MTLPTTTPLRPATGKRNFSALSLEDAMGLVPAIDFTPWHFDATEITPSSTLLDVLSRLEYYDLTESEQSKIALMDAINLEILPRHKVLKVWKAKQLETDTLTGFADFLIAPKRAFLKSPILCAVEAKKDDFEQGQIQCVAEMVACRWNNERSNIRRPVYGIVSNGNGWQFFCLSLQNEVLQSEQYGIGSLPQLLGVVDYVFGECAKNVVL